MKKIAFLFLLSVKLLIFSATKDEILSDIKNNGVLSVDFVFTDILGNIKSVKIASNSVKSVLESGLKFDGSSIPGCSEITSSDMHLAPDLSTWRILPKVLSKNSQGLIICDVCISELEPYLGDPRQMLKHTLRSTNLKLIAGVELEFYLLDSSNKPFDSGSYFDLSISSKINNIINLLFRSFGEFNINMVKEHHEVSRGQLEFVIGHDEALSVADQVVLAKYLIRSIAEQNGLSANFMPKPIFGINGSGMHIHFSLFDNDGNNIFYDSNGEFYLSGIARSFIAGILLHIKDLSPLFNGVINSYKRLVPGYEAPTFICWGAKNRSSLIRIPLVNKDEPNAVRAEIRSPDPMCNPYLALNALALAGFSGITQNLVPVNPVSENLYKLTESKINDLGIVSLPISLKESISNFESSLFVKSVFNSKFIEQFVKLKKFEIREFEVAVTDWEIKKYS
jgi:glutamine synthetase